MHNLDAPPAALAAAQNRIIKARERASMFAQIASLKTLLAQETGHAGWRRMRPPLLPLSQENADKLLATSLVKEFAGRGL